jgi:hypothetical protein
LHFTKANKLTASGFGDMTGFGELSKIRVLLKLFGQFCQLSKLAGLPLPGATSSKMNCASEMTQ